VRNNGVTLKEEENIIKASGNRNLGRISELKNRGTARS
jgi:hypothetical protein